MRMPIDKDVQSAPQPEAAPAAGAPQPAGGDAGGAAAGTVARRLTAWAAPVSALCALVAGVTVLRDRVESLARTKDPLVVWAIAAIPLVLALAIQLTQVLLRRRRERRLEEAAKEAAVVPGAYFRTTAYQDSDEDRKAYKRRDGQHERVLEWLRRAADAVLYLSGDSGVGKSSMVNAYLVPQLRDRPAGRLAVVVRGFEDPLAALERELVRSRLVDGAAAAAEPAGGAARCRRLLELARGAAGVQSLLVVFDQFEEFLIVQDRFDERSKEIEKLLQGLQADRPVGVTVLVVFRSEKMEDLQRLDLPNLSLNRNWIKVEPFDRAAALEFLRGAHLATRDRDVEHIVDSAWEVDDSKPGTATPIVLNMLGIVLRNAKARAVRNKDAVAVLAADLRHTVRHSDAGPYAHQVLTRLLNEPNRGHAAQDLAKETGLTLSQVKGSLNGLAIAGVVRQVSVEGGVWEVSMDFVARLIRPVVKHWHRDLFAKAQPYLALAALTLWLAAFFVFLPLVRDGLYRRAVQRIELRRGKVVALDDGAGVRVSFPPNTPDIDRCLRHVAEMGNVVELDLRGTRLRPGDLRLITGMKSLRTLDLSDTAVGNSGMLYVGYLTGLRELRLGHCDVSDNGAGYLAGLPALEDLDLRNNPVGDGGLQKLDEVVHRLSSLNLSGTEVNGDVFRLWKGMPLKKLGLRETHVGARELADLKKLPSLRELDLSQNTIPDQGYAFLESMPALAVLHAERTLLTDTAVDNLANCQGLKQLDLSHTTVSDVGVRRLGNVSAVEKLDLSYTKVTDAAVGVIARWPNLEELDLSYTAVTGKGIAALRQARALRVLRLSRTGVSEEGLDALAAIPTLREVYLDGTRLCDAGVGALAKAAAIEHLDASDTDISDHALMSLGPVTTLKKLEVWGTRVTRDGKKELRDKRPGVTIDGP
jgi:Leucine-rich repeat (LRR) protein